MAKAAKRPQKKPAPSAKPSGLAQAIVDAPRLAAAKASRARLAEWLESIARTPAGKALNRLVGSTPKLSALLTGLAEHSTYLWDLASEQPARLLTILESDPVPYFDALLTKAERAATTAKTEAEAMRALRRMKSEAALLIALTDIGGVWPVMQTTTAVTALADRATSAAVKFL